MKSNHKNLLILAAVVGLTWYLSRRSVVAVNQARSVVTDSGFLDSGFFAGSDILGP